MELVLLGIVLLCLYAFVRLAAQFSAWVSGSRYRAYRLLATTYKGRYEGRGLSDPPTVSFVHKGSNVRVGLAPVLPGQHTKPRSRVVARFGRGIPFRFELAPAVRPSPPQPPKGTRVVRVGEPDFDRTFIVQANDPDMAIAVLGREVRTAIGQLLSLCPPSGMLISINPERLLVQVDRNLALQSDHLLRAVALAIIVLDGVLAGVSSRQGQGIEIVDAGPATPDEAGPPICKVCGEPINGPAVVCAQCKTPHHRDCWEFVGACSIYGCNSRQNQSA